MASNGNGKKALIRAIAIAAATLVEQAVTGAIERIMDWAKTRRSRDKPGPKT